MADKEKEKKAEKPKMLGTSEIAAKLKVDPKFLRTVLRSMGKKAEAGEGARYEWKPDADLTRLKDAVADYKDKAEKRAKSAAEKKANEKKAKPVKKADKAAPKKAAKKAKPAAEESEEEETEELE